MRSLSPEEEVRDLQRELDDLHVFAPRLGTHPDRVKSNAVWAWVGALVFSPMATVGVAGHQAAPVAGVGVLVAAVVCAAVTLIYKRAFWRTVERVWADKRALDERRAAARVPLVEGQEA